VRGLCALQTHKRYLLRVYRDFALRRQHGARHVQPRFSARSLSKPTAEPFITPIAISTGIRSISNNRWPCCSGTFPQIAADYRISAYFRDEQGVYVNLFAVYTSVDARLIQNLPNAKRELSF